MADVPQWANAELSKQLPSIREAGESPTVEFKEAFPEKALKLAQELAAFGTSGGGTAYIGVNDNGEIVGLDAPNGDARDDAIERAQGIVSSVNPALKADIIFGVEDGKAVLAIRVPAQDEPVFYKDDRP